MPPRTTPSKPSPRKGKTKVNFGTNGASRKRKPDAAGEPDPAAEPSSKKRPRTNGSSGSAGTGPSTSTGTAGARDSGSTNDSSSAGATSDKAAETTPTKKGSRNPWGIRPKEVPQNAKMTQRAFQRVIRALCGLLRQTDMLPPAIGAQKHYDKRFDDTNNFREHMQAIVHESRTAIRPAMDLATKLVRDAECISGPIANDIARISRVYLASVFTMIMKAGLQSFCPDLEGPVQSNYNQLHCHLAVSGFQFLTTSFALGALDVNVKVADDTMLLFDMYDNYVYGTLAQKTKMERRRPSSVSKAIMHGVEYKARTRLGKVRFDTTIQLGLRKPVQRMAYIQEVHSDDEDGHVREKPGCNPIVTKFFLEEVDPAAEAYRKRNMTSGQREPKPRTRSNPLRPASAFGTILPADIPIDFFSPEFYNALTVKERTRYVDTGVAFPLAAIAFDSVHAAWKTMGKKEFMEKYGYDVLEQYNIPSAEEVDVIPDSDAEDEEVEINLEDTEDEDDDEPHMDVDAEEE
ncbi:hypothetical protein B0H14DRAFT_3169164 [Mycena olivaceomarginata]|nr:hypothetical protein B0H14DRAFT_3169164 [Mycena olivaceomarginata]